MNSVEDIIRAQLTLCSSKLAAEKMNNLVSNIELSILSLLFVLGETEKTIIFELIDRDQTTISHAATKLLKKGYITESVSADRRKRHCKLTTAGTAIYTQYIISSSKKSAEIKALMPKTHIEKQGKAGDNRPNG